MISKNKIIIIGIVIILLLVMCIVDVLIPRIDIVLNGDKFVVVHVNDNYDDKGATAYLKRLSGKKELTVETNGNVDTKQIGKFVIKYVAKYHNYSKENVRVVSVVDQESPIIKVNKQITACKANNVVNIDANATDNYDGDLTDKIKYNINDDEITLVVYDSSDNCGKISEKLEFIDSEKPTIQINDKKEINLEVGDKYIEYGASANDSCDGDLTPNIKIDGTVDVNKSGKYTLKYTVSDSFGNEVTATRIVNINEGTKKVKQKEYKSEKSTIYLTFDDGPGKYTAELLDLLDKYNIKATFFVTNQFPKYQSLIKEEKTRGHTIGVHTYTHKWSIYKSVNTYLDDFNKMQKIIIDQTGEESKIFRFPGGSSNTVSRKYCKGIMTKLADIMTQKGYEYFDWDFDSGDTSKVDNSKEAIINNVEKRLKGNDSYIILMHDIRKNTIEALPTIIEYAKSKGYKFAPLDENVNPAHLHIAN
jgi:peptidoglycan/xylan/chitin deacetylase (PgdA/CDA1 family)